MAELKSKLDKMNSTMRIPNKYNSVENVIFILLLDTDNKTQSNMIIAELNRLLRNLVTFSSALACIDYIRQLPEDTKVVVIVEHEIQAKPLVSVLDDLKQISALYIIDNTIDHGSERRRIRHFNSPSLLVDHVQTRFSNAKNQPLPIHWFNQHQKTMLDLSKEAASFMWGHLALAVLQQLPVQKNSFDDMIAACEKFYRDDDFELMRIDELRRTYQSNEAIKWYSRPCFLFRLVNRVLRIEDIDDVFAFRQIIVDLHKQIATEHTKQRRSMSCRRVYHGQSLTASELAQFKNGIGNLISMKSFFSTSADRRVATLFIEQNESTDRIIRALFIIDVDMNLEETVCADITNLSWIPDELEVLFSFSSVFRVVDISYKTEEDLWEVYLQASDEGRETLRNYELLTLEADDNNNAYLLFVRFLYNRGLYEKCINYCSSLSKLIPTNDVSNRISLEMIHGRSLLLLGKYDESQATLLRALALAENVESNKYLLCQLSIADSYMHTNKYEAALQLYQQVLEVQRKIFPKDHNQISDSLSGIGWALTKMGHAEEALEYNIQSLTMRQRILPEFHPSIRHALITVGTAYDSQCRWLEAQNYFIQAYEFTKKFLPHTHVLHAYSLLHVGAVHANLGNYDIAFDYYSQALEIYEHNFKDGNPSIANILDNLANIHRERKEFDLAFDCLNRSLAIRDKVLPPEHLSFGATFHCLAKVYLDAGQNEIAIDYFLKALTIKEKHLQQTHPSVLRTRSCLATAYSHKGQYELSTQTFERTLLMQQANHPKGHPDIGVTMHHMASNYWKINNHVKALEFYQESLAINRKFFPSNHIEIRSVENKIHCLLQEKNEEPASMPS